MRNRGAGSWPGRTGVCWLSCSCSAAVPHHPADLPAPRPPAPAAEGKAAAAAEPEPAPAGVPDFWMVAIRNALEEESVRFGCVSCSFVSCVPFSRFLVAAAGGWRRSRCALVFLAPCSVPFFRAPEPAAGRRSRCAPPAASLFLSSGCLLLQRPGGCGGWGAVGAPSCVPNQPTHQPAAPQPPGQRQGRGGPLLLHRRALRGVP